MQTIIDWVLANPALTLIGAVTIVQVTPIKINPWSWLLRQIRHALVGELQMSVEHLTKDLEGEKIASKRWRVLDFADCERAGRKHSQ